MKDIIGLVVIVIGGVFGFGVVIVEMLVEVGVKVILFDMNEEVGQVYVEKIGGIFLKVDVIDEDNVQFVIVIVELQNGVVRILVNCVGIVIGVKIVGRESKFYFLG